MKLVTLVGLVAALSGCGASAPPDVAAPAAELIDTPWTLETVFIGDVAASTVGEPATLIFRSDGTLSGSTGCHDFDGAWSENDEGLDVTNLAVDDRACQAGVRDQDAGVLSVIDHGFHLEVDAQLLTLTDPGGVGLVYRADE